MTRHNLPALADQDPNQGLLPAVATYLTDQDHRCIEDALDHGISPNTRVMCTLAWRSFENWAQGRWTMTATAR